MHFILLVLVSFIAIVARCAPHSIVEPWRIINAKTGEHEERQGPRLHWAASYNDGTLVRDLIAHGETLAVRDDKGATALHIAAYFGRLESVKALLCRDNSCSELETGATELLNSVDYDGGTPLHYAARGGKERAIALLIKLGADVSAQARSGAMPLHIAAAVGMSASVRTLVRALEEKGLSNVIHMPYSESGASAIAAACAAGHTSTVEQLLEAGGCATCRHQHGRTLLHLAAASSSPSLVTMLLDYGARADVVDEDGATPVHVAVAANSNAIYRILAQSARGKEALRVSDKSGKTPLELAESLGYVLVMPSR